MMRTVNLYLNTPPPSILNNLIEGESISDEAQQQITDEAQFNPPNKKEGRHR